MKTCEVECPYWIMGYCELVEPCPVVGAELQRGFMVCFAKHVVNKWVVGFIEKCGEVTTLKQELARVRGEVRCPNPIHAQNLQGLTWRDCPDCQGTGKKYPEES